MATFNSYESLECRYVWPYFTRINNNAECNFCGANYNLKKNEASIKSHIQYDHKEVYDSIRLNSKRKFEWPFSITEDNRAKCDICHIHYDTNYVVSAKMKEHLKEIHKIDENTMKEHRDWILNSNHVILNESSDTMMCKYCQQIFQNNDYFNLMKHLIDAHQISVPLEVRSSCLSKSSSNLLNKGAEDIITSSNYQQPTTIFDDNSDIDVCEVSDNSDIDVCKVSDNSDIDICN